MDAPWRVEMLGGLRATLGERVVTRFRSHQTAGLLAYLAYYRQRSHPREALIEQLWPEREPEAGRNSFRVALSSLRRQLEPPGVPAGAVLIADRALLQLNPAAAVTDVAAFEAAIRSADRSGSARERAERLAEAAELYRGELLPGFFEEWVYPERQRLAEAYLHALDRLLALHRQEGDLAGALQYARRAVAADPLREEAHQEVMRLLLALGQPEAARRQFEELAQLLARELEAEPSPESSALARQMQAPSGPAIATSTVIAPAERLPNPDAVAPSLPSAALPTGTVTFLLIDVEGAHLSREGSGQAAWETVSHPQVLLRVLFRRHRGVEVQAHGDGCEVVFQRAGDALGAALAGQRALASAAAAAPVGVRMALHTGDVEWQAGDYQGPALHCARRILMAGHAGQILCSEETAGLVRRELDPSVDLVELGVYRLQAVITPERLFQVHDPETGPCEFPPLNAAPAHTGRLPLQFTRFIGREEEIARLSDLLGELCRLVTLTGPGGTGKTRLALEVARRQSERLHGAVWFVALADLHSPGMILDKLLEVMQLPPSPRIEPLDQVVAALARQPSLLLLDSFEHLLGDGAPLVQSLLERVSTLVVLATSRQRLGLPGEQEFPVAPLPVPEASEGRKVWAGTGPHPTPHTLTQFPSVALFVDRAQAARPDFQVTRANAAAVAALCTRLEGLPLAIELAAAWARVLTPEQMLVRLEQRFELLVRRGREVDPRHGSLRATLDSSYQALSPELQRFFARLSIFRGGWTLEAAEAVCDDLGLRALEALHQLCECSLVQAEETGESSSLAAPPAEMRYRLLETLRDYAAEQLTVEECALLAQGHATYYCALAERAEPELQGPGQVIWLERLDREHDNLRAALVWAGEAVGSGAVELGLRLAGSLWEFWAPRGHVREGREHLARLLSLPEAGARTAVRAKALACAAILADFQGEHAAARALHEEGLAIRRELGDPWGIDFSLTALGYVAEHQGDYPAARAFQEEALALSRERQDQVGIAWSLNNLADVTWHQGEYAAARTYFQESLEIRCELGDHWGAAFSQSGLGTMALNLGDLEAARSLHEASLALRRELGDQRGIATSLTNLGHVARRQGDSAKARALLEEGLAMQQELGDQGGAADSLYGLGWVALKEGDGETACRLLEESLSLQRELGNREALAGCLEALAAVVAHSPSGSPERAVRLFAAAAARREAIGAPLPPVDRTDYEHQIAALRAALGEPAFAAAWEAGRALSLEEATAEALSRAAGG